MKARVSRSLAPRIGQVAAALVVVSIAVAMAAAAAVGRTATTPSASQLAGGEKLFTTVGCSACHTFKAAAATGKIGPSLDPVKLTTAQLVTQISKGGCAVLTPAACAKYASKMSAFKPRLTTAQIADVAAFVYAYRDAIVLTPGSCVTVGGSRVCAAPGTSTATSTGPTTTGKTTTTPTSTGTTPGTTTTPAGGGGGGGAQPECPPGVTIQTSGQTDGDTDETGAPTDFDGCL